MTGTGARKRLGEILLEAELISAARLQAALRLQRIRGKRLGSTLLETGFIREEDLLRCLSIQLQVPSVNLREVLVSPPVLRLLPARIAEKHHAFPVAVRRESGRRTLLLAMAEPNNLDILREIQFQTGMGVRPAVAMESSILRAIARYYRFRGHAERSSEVPAAELSSGNGDEVSLAKGSGNGAAASLFDLDSRQMARAMLAVLLRRGLLSRDDLRTVLEHVPSGAPGSTAS